MSTPTIDHDRDHDLDLASRVGRLEGLVEQIALRLDGLERRIEALEQTMAAGFAELRQAIAAANEATNNRIESTNNPHRVHQQPHGQTISLAHRHSVWHHRPACDHPLERRLNASFSPLRPALKYHKFNLIEESIR